MSKPIPQPRALPFIGNLLDLQDEVPVRAVEHLADTYGSIFKLKTRFCKAIPPGLARVKRTGRAGLFTATHESEPDWGLAHRVLMPAFGPLAIRDMFDEMHDIANQLVLKWARRGPENRILATDDFTRLTLDTIALCAMDFRFNSFYQDDLHPFVIAMNHTLGAGGSTKLSVSGLMGKLLDPSNSKLEADYKLQNDTAKQLVLHRREHPSGKKDLLNAMINGQDPKTGEKMDNDLITANMITFLVAGHETTSGLLSFAFLYLLKNPAAYRNAQQEVDRVVGKGKLRVEHLKDLAYINAVLRETLRLTPTVPAFARRIRPESTETSPTLGKGQYAMEKDSTVLCLISKVHRDPKVYGEDANSFRPERMMDGNFEKLPKSAWKPFGTGLRACIGRPFAWQEALLVTALLLQNFNFRLDDPNYEMQIKQALTIKPRDFYMRATLRPGIAATTLQDKLTDPGTSNTAVTNGVSTKGHEAMGSEQSLPMTILYGSNTGTCESMAQKLASDAHAHGFQASIKEMDAAVGSLPKEQPVVIVTASYEGQPTDNAAHFVKWLETFSDGKDLAGTSFAVFGCGHSDWSSTFQHIPKVVDELLATHGAKRIVDRGLTDVARGDIFGDFDTWADQMFWPTVTKDLAHKATGQTGKVPALELQVSTHNRVVSLRQDVRPGKVQAASILTAPGESQKRHLEVMLPTDMTYETGNYLAVLPLNPKSTVERAMAQFSLPWDAIVNIKSSGPTTLPVDKPLPAFDLLRGYVELAQPATRKDIQKGITFASDKREIEELDSLSSEKFHDEIVQKRISVLDLVHRFPSMQLTFGDFLALLPPMRLRHYSISSSPLQKADSCTITYGVIDDVSLSGKGRFLGVAGNYLASLQPGDDVQVSVRSTTKYFHLPLEVDRTPIVMFCAGTGLAPFRGFVQERATQLSLAGRSLAPAILFVGCRSSTRDRLYAEELDAWAGQGAVDIRYAFSQEPDKSDGCRYVQDRILQDRADIIKMWQQGAKIFVCGSRGLADSVSTAARELVVARAKEMDMDYSDEKLQGWFQEMRNQRFVTDVFA